MLHRLSLDLSALQTINNTPQQQTFPLSLHSSEPLLKKKDHLQSCAISAVLKSIAQQGRVSTVPAALV